MKRVLYILFLLLLLTCMSGFMLVMLLRSSRVQTAGVQLLTEQLSRGLNADVHIDKVSFHFLNRLQVEGLYISDQAGDTLLYVPTTEIRFRPQSLDNDLLHFTSIRFLQPYLNIKQGEQYGNYEFIIRAFSTDKEREPLNLPLRIDKIGIDKANVHLRHLPTDYDIYLTPIDLQLSLPWIYKDSINAVLDGLTINAYVKNIDTRISGSFHGSLDTIYADQLSLFYRKERMLLGSVALTNPLSINQMNAHIDCQDLYANTRLIEGLISDITKQPAQLPPLLTPLGDMHYRGILNGRLDSLTLHGAFITDIGSVNTDCYVSLDTSFSDIRFVGQIAAKRLQLNKLLPRSSLGRLSMTSDLTLHYIKDRPLEAKGEIRIPSLTYNRYTYRNVLLKGKMHNNKTNGIIALHDPNINLVIGGTTQRQDNNTKANLSLLLNHLRLQPLHLADNMTDQDMRLRATLDLTAQGNENTPVSTFDSRLQIDSLCFTRMEREFVISSLNTNIYSNNHTGGLKMESDFVNAGINGSFQWNTLPLTLRHFGYALFPKLLGKRPQAHTDNDLDFYCYFNHLDSILSVVALTDIQLPDQQTIKGHIAESNNEYGMQIYVPSVNSEKSQTKDIVLSLAQKNDLASISLSLQEHPIISDSVKLKVVDIDFNLYTEARQDSLLTTLRFGAVDDTTHGMSAIELKTYLSQYNKRPLISTHIVPSTFYLRDTLWTLSDSYIQYTGANTRLTVDNFRLQSTSQHIYAHGTNSKTMDDSIRIDLKNVDLGYIMRNFDLEHAISADGDVTGWATLYALFGTPMLEASLHMNEGYLNRTLLGELDATARLDNKNKHILIDAIARQNDRHTVELNGLVIPQDKYWELNMKLDSTDMNLINYWTYRVLDNVQGRAYGNLNVYGRRHKTWVRGRLLGKEASLTVPITGVRYTFTDSVFLDTFNIRFPDIHFRDTYGHQGILNGEVTHDYFYDFGYDIRLGVNDMLVVNLPYSARQMMYGKVYATGNVHVFGDEEFGTQVDVNATSRGNTDFYLNTGRASEATDNSFIFFTTDEEDEAELTTAPTIKHIRKSTNPVYLNMNIGISPSSLIHLMLDSRTGDGIVGHGEGDLRLHYDSEKSETQLFGTYTMQEGLFSYSIGNIIRRDFAIKDGSAVTWTGDLTAPTLSVAAAYKVTASLRDLFGSDASELATNRSSAPVECMIYLSDRLTNPTLRFGIELPQSDESVAAQVKSIINTDEMLMRQVIYLLVFNRFFTPEYLQNTTYGANETYSLISSTITGQINQWLSRLTDIVTIGFNFRTDGEGATASQEYETMIQLHPINRLSINGNVGYRYNDLSNRPFFGDVDIEYQLTEDGKLRVKGFTHTVDKYSLKQANTVQGVGLIFRHDFNWGDSRRKRQQKAAQQKENK